MRGRGRYARVNVKVLVILILVVVALGVSLVAARQIRRSILSKAALTAGEGALAKEDWPAAVKNLREYLGRNPDDVEILKKYGKALLAVRPLETPGLLGAISAYRRVLQVTPGDAQAYEELAKLYPAVGNYEDLAYIARMRLEQDPNNRKAPLWLAEASLRLNKPEEARQALEKLLAALKPLPDKDKPAEYVQACADMSQIVMDWNSEPARAKALDWLKDAVDCGADPARARALRAQFYRVSAARAVDEATKSKLVASARQDLEAADAAGTDDAQVLYFLGVEWMESGELDRAAKELAAIDQLPREKLQEQFLTMNNWKVARFRFASELAKRHRAFAEAAALADDALAALTEKPLRAQVLPGAIPLYVAANKVAAARKCLDEYLDMVHSQQGQTGSPLNLAWLQAIVEAAENKPYAVIDTLQPLTVGTSADPEMWRVWRLLADAYSRTNQTARAMNAQLQYLRFAPNDPNMLRELAKQYSRMGDWKNAMETAQKAEKAGATDLATKLLRLGAAISLAAPPEGKPDVAKLKALSAELDGLHQAQPDQADIRIFQALIAGALEQPQEKERLLKLAIDECKDPLRAEMQLAAYYVGTKRAPEAVKVCEAACKRQPEVAEPWASLSDLYVANSDYATAQKVLQQGLDAVKDEAGKRSLSMKLALLDLLHGDRTAGINRLKELAAQDPRDIQTRLLLLRTREVGQDRATAEKLIDELKKAEGQSGLQWRLQEAYLWLSSDGWRSKQQDITERLQYCIDANPKWSEPVLYLAGMYEKLGDVRHAEDTYRQALARNPSATEIADGLLGLMERQGRFAEAEKVLQQMQADPGFASAWNVRLAQGSGDVSRAIDELKLRVANDSQDARSRIELARLIYQQTKDADQALRYLKEAEALAPNPRTLAAVKAMILGGEGRTEESRQVLDQYVAEHNDFTAYWMRAVFLAGKGQLEQAESDYKKLTTFAQEGATGYVLLANFYSTTQRLDQAIATLEEGRKAYPADQRLPRMEVQLLSERGQADDLVEAEKMLADLEKQQPQDPGLMLIRARQLMAAADSTPASRKAAREKLEEIVKLQPTMVEAHLRLIDLALQEGQYQAARDYAARALGSNPNNSLLLSAKGRAELALGDTQMAVELAHSALRQDQTTTDNVAQATAADLLAQAALAGQDQSLLEEARPLLETAVGRDPNNARLLLVRAQVLAALKQPEKGIPELEAYCRTKQGAGSIAAILTLADLYRQGGNAEKSKQWIDQAERLDPGNQAVVHARVLWLVSQERFEELKGISSAYLSAKVQDPAVLVRGGSILAASDSADLKKEGIKLFEQAATLAPTLVEARLGLATTLYQTGDVDRAVQTYRELLKQNPNNAQVLNDLAWILQERYQRYDEALKLADQGLALARDDVHLLDTRGTILMNMPGRLADARKDFERLLPLSSSDNRRQAGTLLQLGRVCVKLNDVAQARQYLQKALEIDGQAKVLSPEERSEIEKIMPPAGR